MKKYIIPICAFSIVFLSLLTLYSAAYSDGPWQASSVFMRQLIWVALGWSAFFIFSRFHYRNLLSLAYPFYIVLILFLAAVLIIGGVRLGAQRWIKIWWFNFQPSEFVKIAVVLVLSQYFSRKEFGAINANASRLSFYRGLVLPFLIIALPFGLILKQPDLGTGLMILFIFLGMVYYSAVKMRYLIFILASGAAFSPIFWHFLKDYQRDRLLVFMNPNSDPLGAGYTVIQSKIAIGAGGFFGKGWLSGTQGQLNFLPEAHTDFIFGVFSEETGFIGAVLLIGLYYIMIQRVITISERANDEFGRLVSFGIGLMLAVQVYVNISMTLGFSPVVGLPLPLMSYGGSSMLATLICLGILYNIDNAK